MVLLLTSLKIIGTAMVGVANIIIFMAVSLALVDTFTIYAASALAANTVVRSIAGAVLPVSPLCEAYLLTGPLTLLPAGRSPDVPDSRHGLG